MTPAASIGNNATLDRWRTEVGYATFAEAPGVVRILSGTVPKGLPPMQKASLPGVPLPVSRLVIGCDNRDTLAEGAIVWDAWMEAGGNAFDTAFVYGAGRHEVVLGQWIASRGVADEIVVIAKGAHTPYCTPRAIASQLDASQERLGLDHVRVYIMHRDNPDVPVGEFVDAVSRLRDAGRIGIWGGSNWTPARFAEAVGYATANGLEPPRILNNNLSLAVMERPVWPGCVTSNTPATLAFLREGGVTHLSWSSQARGYFLPENLRDRLPADTRPETCYGSEANAERRRRAEALAAERGVSAHNVATAWVLAQSFPSFALIGPRSPGEIASTLPGLSIELTPEEVAWLNLEG
jgi:aryl-alcohol dehydrogenase-like predicted oxidoreductase